MQANWPGPSALFWQTTCQPVLLWQTAQRPSHRFWKSLNRLLKVCDVPATSTVLNSLFSSFLLRPLTVLIKQTRQPVCAIKQSIYLDVYGPSPVRLPCFGRLLINPAHLPCFVNVLAISTHVEVHFLKIICLEQSTFLRCLWLFQNLLFTF